MTGSHESPELHGLGAVKGGRLLLVVAVAVALVAVMAVIRARSRAGDEAAPAPIASGGTVSLAEAAQRQAGIATEAVKRLTQQLGAAAGNP